MTAEKEQAYLEIVAKGERARRFFESDFWRKDLEPYVNSSKEVLILANAQIAGKVLQSQEHGVIEKIAVTVSLNSGQLNFIEILLGEINSWVKMANEAKVKLEENYAKKG